MRKGIFFVVSAPSGTGKTTLCHKVLDTLENIRFTTSYTTRKPRPNEVDGKHYYFIDQVKFEQVMVDRFGDRLGLAPEVRTPSHPQLVEST